MKDDYTIPLHALLETGGMTEEHLEIYEDLYESYHKKVSPEIYGRFLPDAIEFVGFRLQNIEDMTFNQKSRSGSLNKKKTEIAQSIRQNGWKLKYHAIAKLDHFNWEEVITGNTRAQIAVEEGLKTIVVAVYRGKRGYSNQAVKEAFIYCSQIFNTDVDPASPASMEDIQRAVSDLCKMYEDTKGEYGVNPADLEGIKKAVNRCCGNGQFHIETRSFMSYSVYNQYNPNDIVVSWQRGKGAAYRIQEYMKEYKFEDTVSVKYHAAAASSPLKAYSAALEIWHEHRPTEVRIVIHTGTLTGYDLETNYVKRIREFIDWFTKFAQKDSMIHDGNYAEFKKRVKIYAAMPALSRVHDLHKPVFINTRQKSLYQRGEGQQYEVMFDEYDLIEFSDAA